MQGHGLDRETKEAILKLAGITMVQDNDGSWGWTKGDAEPRIYFWHYKRALKEAMKWWRKQQEK
jgi:hypothetical protein